MHIASIVAAGAILLNFASTITIKKRNKDAELRTAEAVKQFQEAEQTERKKHKYTLICDFGDEGINADEEDARVKRELRIYLDGHDWYKFQNQPFYQDLMNYLDSI